MAPSHPSAVDLKDGMDDEWMMFPWLSVFDPFPRGLVARL